MTQPERIDFNPATIQPLGPTPTRKSSDGPARTTDGRTFEDVLRTKVRDATSTTTAGSTATTLDQAPVESSITWSAHAAARLRQRGIELTPDQTQRLETAVDKAAAKGAKDALVLLDDNAMVVSVTNRTVITALGTHQAKENVFTNIDSAVIA
jgi:flagellar operon protein